VSALSQAAVDQKPSIRWGALYLYSDPQEGPYEGHAASWVRITRMHVALERSAEGRDGRLASAVPESIQVLIACRPLSCRTATNRPYRAISHAECQGRCSAEACSRCRPPSSREVRAVFAVGQRSTACCACLPQAVAALGSSIALQRSQLLAMPYGRSATPAAWSALYRGAFMLGWAAAADPPFDRDDVF